MIVGGRDRDTDLRDWPTRGTFGYLLGVKWSKYKSSMGVKGEEHSSLWYRPLVYVLQTGRESGFLVFGWYLYRFYLQVNIILNVCSFLFLSFT